MGYVIMNNRASVCGNGTSCLRFKMQAVVMNKTGETFNRIKQVPKH